MTNDEQDKMRKRAEFDQMSAEVGDSFPGLWRRIYLNCVKEGFTAVESMDLVKTWILSVGPR